uniref:BTB domain-containing protein n=1 Tax=Panagrolaimus sp. ES5 TaxID=591445 RepID=A0AC34GY73_9BILA
METVKIDIPIAIRWKISKDQLKNGLQTGRILSDMFKNDEIPDIEYCLAITSDSTKQINISLALSMEEPKIIAADFKVFIYSENIFYHINSTFEKSEFLGKEICLMKELFDESYNYFVDNKLIITMEGILSVEKEKQQIFGEVFGIKNNIILDEFSWDDENGNKDFDVHVDGKVIKVHKNVVKAMLQSKTDKIEENQIAITDFDFKIVETAIKYFYGINITVLLNISDGIKLLQFADVYGISNLKESMEKYLFQQKSPTNICKIVNASILSNSIKLREQCLDYLIECQKKSIFVKDLDTLDKYFALNLLKASFTCCV